MDRPSFDPLLLDHQLCFRFYTVSRLITRLYQPYLDRLGITYLQYLVLLVLWEQDGVSVGVLVNRLGLNTNTLTPLLKRMEQAGLLTRTKAREDERKVLIALTQAGADLRKDAIGIPAAVSSRISDGTDMEQYEALATLLDGLIEKLEKSIQ